MARRGKPSGHSHHSDVRSIVMAGKNSIAMPSRVTHGMADSPEYRVWCHVLARCGTATDAAYDNYGGRGITVCDRWLTFTNFYADVGPRPSPQHTLERIENDGNYEPGNVRWATRKEQNRNKRNNRLLTFNGRTQCIAAWAEEIGITWAALRARLRLGWSVERALTPGDHRRTPASSATP
jgi:hypothetical protein